MAKVSVFLVDLNYLTNTLQNYCKSYLRWRLSTCFLWLNNTREYYIRGYMIYRSKVLILRGFILPCN